MFDVAARPAKTVRAAANELGRNKVHKSSELLGERNDACRTDSQRDLFLQDLRRDEWSDLFDSCVDQEFSNVLYIVQIDLVSRIDLAGLSIFICGRC
jgi:hypothetical protein